MVSDRSMRRIRLDILLSTMMASACVEDAHEGNDDVATLAFTSGESHESDESGESETEQHRLPERDGLHQRLLPPPGRVSGPDLA
jgi:hypothetical protein